MLRTVCASAFAAGVISLCAAGQAAAYGVPCGNAASDIAAAGDWPTPTDSGTAQAQISNLQPAISCLVSHDTPTHTNALGFINDTSDPVVQAAVLNVLPQTETGGDTPPSITGENTNSSASCWGKHVTSDTVGFSYTISAGTRSVEEDGWCGNGVSVTKVDGPIYNSSTRPGFCWANVNQNSGNKAGPAGPNVWWHEENDAQLGVGFSWGCLAAQSVNPGLEVKGNGYWDHHF